MHIVRLSSLPPPPASSFPPPSHPPLLSSPPPTHLSSSSPSPAAPPPPPSPRPRRRHGNQYRRRCWLRRRPPFPLILGAPVQHGARTASPPPPALSSFPPLPHPRAAASPREMVAGSDGATGLWCGTRSVPRRHPALATVPRERPRWWPLALLPPHPRRCLLA
ncbi:hypothetical protein PVAP13_8NG189304 [Panicum virgatum]|uniref:Uncharacterized protein n=1 Tax=Panicum virgatum TaxID=38727 RepID=A0A8T0P5Y6_PANVG|nr:hypothetical protein PVAP13_8NG189304 [Panicum virgatum]